MAVVEKQLWPQAFQSILEGATSHEFRSENGEIAAGDVLRLRELDPVHGDYTGRELQRRARQVCRFRPGESKNPVSTEEIAQPAIQLVEFE